MVIVPTRRGEVNLPEGLVPEGFKGNRITASFDDAGATRSDPAAFHVEMDFARSRTIGVHAADQGLRVLGFHAYPGSWGVWWRTGAFEHQFAADFDKTVV